VRPHVAVKFVMIDLRPEERAGLLWEVAHNYTCGKGLPSLPVRFYFFFLFWFYFFFFNFSLATARAACPPSLPPCPRQTTAHTLKSTV
jgi:hypothetical protein